MEGLKLVCLDCGQTNRVASDKPTQAAKCGTCGAPLVAAKPIEIDGATLGRAARSDDLPLVVDFWAPWCGPCRAMAPQFAEASRQLAGQARLAKVNTEDHPQAGRKQGIRGIPTMVMWRGGREVARMSGAMTADRIVDWVRQQSATRA